MRRARNTAPPPRGLLLVGRQDAPSLSSAGRALRWPQVGHPTTSSASAAGGERGGSLSVPFRRLLCEHHGLTEGSDGGLAQPELYLGLIDNRVSEVTGGPNLRLFLLNLFSLNKQAILCINTIIYLNMHPGTCPA
ncbi:unnamed protein product [Spodoptera exigua]|nr:unnamed protein product [Spodoptera exigua]